MKYDIEPRLTLDLHFDDKNRLTWRKSLREKVPDACGLRVVWNDNARRFEAYPLDE